MDAAVERKVSLKVFESENVTEEVTANIVDDCEELVAVVGGRPCVADEQGGEGVVTRYEVVLFAGNSSRDHCHRGDHLCLHHAKWFSSLLL